MSAAYHEPERDYPKVTREIEDELLAASLQRRGLSEKVLCARYGLSRSALQRAIRRARQRHSRAAVRPPSVRTAGRKAQQTAGEC
jgi:hypothetical protein